MAKKIYIYVDDERKLSTEMPDDMVSITVRTFFSAQEVLEWIRDKGWEAYIDLDHDLGEAKTGYDICKFIVENQIPLLGYRLHAMNPVGRQNMQQLLSHCGYTQF